MASSSKSSEKDEYRLFVAGRIDDDKYHVAVKICELLTTEYSTVTLKKMGMFESDWDAYVESRSNDFPYEAEDHRNDPLIFLNDNIYVGNDDDLLVWARRNFRLDESRLDRDAAREQADKSFRAMIEKSTRKYCFFDLHEGDTCLGRVIFELYTDKCPRTCKNFELLCRGEVESGGKRLSYKNSILHRVVPGGWVQGGDIDQGSGEGGKSVFGDSFADENFVVKHDRPGILSMAGDHRHSNGSQFFVTFQAHSWLNEKRVAFGRVISGMRILRHVEKCESRNQRPRIDIRISDCGLLLVREQENPSKANIVRLKHAFMDVDRLGCGRVRCQDLLDVIRTSDDFARTFPRHRDGIAELVASYAFVLTNSVPVRCLISQDEFLELATSVLDEKDPNEYPRDSVVYRAANKSVFVARRPSQDEASKRFGLLTGDEMAIISELFDELSASNGGENAEKTEQDEKNDSDSGLVDAALFSSTISKGATLPIDLIEFHEGGSLNLEEVYGFFNACKRSDANAFQAFVSELPSSTAREGSSVATKDASTGRIGK